MIAVELWEDLLQLEARGLVAIAGVDDDAAVQLTSEGEDALQGVDEGRG